MYLQEMAGRKINLPFTPDCGNSSLCLLDKNVIVTMYVKMCLKGVKSYEME